MTQQKNDLVNAFVKGSPLQFKISPDFAHDCLNVIGSVVRHDVLGPMLCDEAIILNDGSISKMVFVGTSTKNGLRRLRCCERLP